MYPRSLEIPSTGRQSFFLFGPRGTGKTTLLEQRFPDAVHLDLLDHALYLELLARPQRLRDLIPPGHDGWVVVDEVQRTPLVLNEVHRLIETAGMRFILTGSSARSLRRRGVNLLGGRARTRHLYPLTAAEAGSDFALGAGADPRPASVGVHPAGPRLVPGIVRRELPPPGGARRRTPPATWPRSAGSWKAPASRRRRPSTCPRWRATWGSTARRLPPTSTCWKTC